MRSARVCILASNWKWKSDIIFIKLLSFTNFGFGQFQHSRDKVDTTLQLKIKHTSLHEIFLEWAGSKFLIFFHTVENFLFEFFKKIVNSAHAKSKKHISARNFHTLASVLTVLLILFQDAYVRHDSKIMTIVHKFQMISRKNFNCPKLLPDFKRKNGVRNVNKQQRCQRTHFSRNNCYFWHFFLLIGDKWSEERGKEWIKKKKSKTAEKWKKSKIKVQ